MGKQVKVGVKVRQAVERLWPNAPWFSSSRQHLQREPVEQAIREDIQKTLKPGETINGTIVGLEPKELIRWIMSEAGGSEFKARRIIAEAQRQEWLGDKYGMKYTLTTSGANYMREVRPGLISHIRSLAGSTPPREGHAARGRPASTPE